MTKKICDRCGAEINPGNSATYVCLSENYIATAFRFIELKPTELCVSCALQLRRWLKGGAEEDEKDSL